MLSVHDPEANDMSPEANMRKAQKLMAQTATIVTTFDRLRHGKEARRRSETRNGCQFPYTLSGKRPDDVMERAFDIALTLHADHELNPSSRGRPRRHPVRYLLRRHRRHRSLKGPLHGGANEDVIKFLLEVDRPTSRQQVRDKLSKKEKIAGRSRVYRTEDPRATHLRELSEEIGKRRAPDCISPPRKSSPSSRDQGPERKRRLLLCVRLLFLGIPVDLYTPIFAVSRMSGWTAHIMEQYKNNRLIRPRAE